MKPQLLLRKTHKWLGLLLGAQILLWFVSGFLMSYMSIDEVRGDHLLKPRTTHPISLKNIDLSKVAAQVEVPIKSIDIKSWLGETVLLVKTQQGNSMYLAPSMEAITPFTESDIQRLLTARLKTPFAVQRIQRLTEVPDEASGRAAPLWVAQLQDAENSRIYISAQTGEIVAKRTDRWRLFDFLWMLHIMDYDERENFNHPLLYLTALSALVFTLTGFALLYFTIRKKRRPKPQVR